MKFTKENVNPKKLKTGDCTIRALAKGLNKSWETIVTDLFNLSLKTKYYCCFELYNEYLKDYKLITPKVIKGKKRLRVKDYKDGTYILRTAHHLTTVINNVNYDTWDNRERCVYRAWKIEVEQ